MGESCTNQSSLGQDGSQSYRDKLLGEIPGAFEQAFNSGCSMESEAESDDEFSDLLLGEKAVKLSGSTKYRIRA